VLVLQPGIPGEAIPIMGMLTGIVSMVLIAYTIIRVAQSQVGQAIARRISGKHAPLEDEVRNELLDLREQVAALEHRLADSEERIDFAERLLAQRAEPVRLEDKAPHAAG
jgi:hypothetical protein